MTFLPIASVGQALQAAALAHGAVSIARAGFDRLLRATLDNLPEAPSAPGPAGTLGLPAPRQGTGASHFGLATRLQSLAEALRERLQHLAPGGIGDGLEVTVAADGSYDVNRPGGAAADTAGLFAADDGLRAVVRQIAEALTDFTRGGVPQTARFTLTGDGATVQAVPG